MDLRRECRPAGPASWGWWFLVTTCLPLVIVAQEVPVARTEEVFTVGFADDDLFFGWIGGLSVAPDGRVLVHDADPGDGPAVTVLAPNGAVVARWGVVGEGPGELSGGPAAVAVEGESVLIAGSVGRIGIYDWSGEELSPIECVTRNVLGGGGFRRTGRGLAANAASCRGQDGFRRDPGASGRGSVEHAHHRIHAPCESADGTPRCRWPYPDDGWSWGMATSIRYGWSQANRGKPSGS